MMLLMLINRRTNEEHNSETEGQFMLQKMRARLNGRVKSKGIPRQADVALGGSG
jgi:hypothetical protein